MDSNVETRPPRGQTIGNRYFPLDFPNAAKCDGLRVPYSGAGSHLRP